MTSKLDMTLTCPAKLEPESFMQFILDLVEMLQEVHNYRYTEKIRMHYQFHAESGRVSKGGVDNR